MKARGEEGKESFLEESPLDNGQDCEGDSLEDFSVPERGIVVPPPSHVSSLSVLMHRNDSSCRGIDRELDFQVYTYLHSALCSM